MLMRVYCKHERLNVGLDSVKFSSEPTVPVCIHKSYYLNTILDSSREKTHLVTSRDKTRKVCLTTFKREDVFDITSTPHVLYTRVDVPCGNNPETNKTTGKKADITGIQGRSAR